MDSLYCRSINDQPYPTDGQKYCNVTFDSVTCWNYTLAGERAYGHCPSNHQYAAMFSAEGYSYKDCTLNGTWWTHPGTGRPWTNYSTCMNLKQLLESRIVIYVYYSGFSVSMVLLTVSLLIFLTCRQLHCTRISIHVHTFVSYIIGAILWILYFKLATLDVYVTTINPLWCRVLHVLTQYATLCNYFWMFCEGLYLQAIIGFVLTCHKRLLNGCLLIGWVFPILPTIVYTVVRGYMNAEKDTQSSCWIHKSSSMWILMVPIVISLLLNALFLFNILRVLLSKLRAINSNECSNYRRTARACLILIPLLGIQYFIMPFEPKQNTFVYDVIRAVVISYQGACVSILFCLSNEEVIQTLKKHTTYRKCHTDIVIESPGKSVHEFLDQTRTVETDHALPNIIRQYQLVNDNDPVIEIENTSI